MSLLKYLQITLFLFVIFSCSAYSQEQLEFRNLGMQINSAENEFRPIVYNDTLYFRRTITARKSKSYRIYNIACSDIAEGSNISSELIEIYDPSIYGNQNPAIDPKASNSGNIDMDPSTASFSKFFKFHARRLSGLEPKRLEFGISSDYTDMHPAFAPDGSFIVFCSDRPRKTGNTEREKDLDLYISYRNEDNTWSKPFNLGSEINTDENEIAPFIANDGRLFYASKGFIYDSVNIVFSGQKKGILTGSDIYILSEKPNYNIIVAENNNSDDEPFINASMLPRPYNTEYNEISAALWKDSLIYIASDRLRPYDRPDKYNQNGYDLYGFLGKVIEEEPIADDLLESFFVTGYYKLLTDENLNELEDMIDMGVIRSNYKNSYIADPRNEYDESGNKIDYRGLVPLVADYLEVITDRIDRGISQLISGSIDSLKIEVIGYVDERGISHNSIYVGEDYIDPILKYYIQNGDPMNNRVLAGLRAYNTTIYLKNQFIQTPEYHKVKDRIKWRHEGRGVWSDSYLKLEKRRIVININDVSI